MSIRKLSDTSFQNKKVLLRCDLNVPLKNGVITDDGRIVASLSTIRKLLDANCSIVIIAHLGRPKGERKPELSLRPIAARLQELSGVEVIFSDIAPDLAEKARNLKPKQIMLIENIRYEAAETIKLATELAKCADLYVGDGFGAVHRKHASVYELAKLLPSFAGDLVINEVEVLQKLTTSPTSPYGVILGGAKVSDKIGVISNLLNKVDLIAIGGGMVFTFLAAKGMKIGKSLVENDLVPEVKQLLKRAEELGVK